VIRVYLCPDDEGIQQGGSFECLILQAFPEEFKETDDIILCRELCRQLLRLVDPVFQLSRFLFETQQLVPGGLLEDSRLDSAQKIGFLILTLYKFRLYYVQL
jgi:hypothetical protein